ncbi:GNAT family protein [Pseudoclavibacter terrae]|uniref:GNAT family N-acetyltransferase n=1 Tax=Pseudoclavibacter terrae TaxID=1530195 RepID=A0A7J5AZP3_9MICO|nr:hypothetical protein [Pseudoclavibacter terrae]KAB1636080.1 hypothetical protein F8O03_17655 [Pseudoclavibacter terrae]
MEATYDFLADEERDEVEAQLESDYFPAVALLVDTTQRNGGAGTTLLTHAIRECSVTRVDVYETNISVAGS